MVGIHFARSKALRPALRITAMRQMMENISETGFCHAPGRYPIIMEPPIASSPVRSRANPPGKIGPIPFAFLVVMARLLS